MWKEEGWWETVPVDSTIQEKNITYLTDTKLKKKIIEKCREIASDEGIALRQSYTRILKQLWWLTSVLGSIPNDARKPMLLPERSRSYQGESSGTWRGNYIMNSWSVIGRIYWSSSRFWVKSSKIIAKPNPFMNPRCNVCKRERRQEA